MTFELLYRDEDFVAIEKPAGFHVHKPENLPFKIPREKICLHLLRDQLDQYVFPVHRLDVATSGILLYALNAEMARDLNLLLASGQAVKTYYAVVRGFTREENGRIEIPLPSDSSDKILDAVTDFQRLAQVEIPTPVGKRHSSARFSLLKVTPHTGRYHQIRRHLARLSHPIIGDREHGDSHQNQYFKRELLVPGLMLRSHVLELKHPRTSAHVRIGSVWPESWKTIFTRFAWQIP